MSGFKTICNQSTLIRFCGECPFASEKTYKYTRKHPDDPYGDVQYIFEKKVRKI